MLWWPGARPRSRGAIWDHLVNPLSAIAQDCWSWQLPCAQDEGQEKPPVWCHHCSTRPAPSSLPAKTMIWCSSTSPQASLRQPPLSPQGESEEHRAPWNHVFEAEQLLHQLHQPSCQVPQIVVSKQLTQRNQQQNRATRYTSIQLVCFAATGNMPLTCS